MTILALDLGTKTGFAIGGDEMPVVSGVWNLKAGRHESQSMRLITLIKQINDLHDAVGISRVYYEEVRRHMSTDAAHWYGAFWGQVTKWCEERDIPYEGVPVGTIKKFATGKGNANKEAMIAAVEGWGFPVEDDNEADALALLHLKLDDAKK